MNESGIAREGSKCGIEEFSMSHTSACAASNSRYRVAPGRRGTDYLGASNSDSVAQTELVYLSYSIAAVKVWNRLGHQLPHGSSDKLEGRNLKTRPKGWADFSAGIDPHISIAGNPRERVTRVRLGSY